MSRTMIFAAILLAGCSSTMVPKANTHDDVKAYVDRATEVVAERGADACATLREPRWYSGDWYIFVFDEEGRTVCHPAQPQNVGTMASALVDANGKRFGDEIMLTSESGGWVDYGWVRPGGTTPTAKNAYVRAVRARDGKKYVVGSGGYELR